MLRLILRNQIVRCFFLLAFISYSKSASGRILNFFRSKDEAKMPRMHTFFEPAYDNVEKQLEDLDVWKEVWRKAGWDTKVLKLEDAKRHPMFDKFREAFDNAEYKINEYNRMCFYRWLAIASSGGGWMSDFDTYPLHSQPLRDGVDLPNNGKFTDYERHVPCLLSGSKAEWDRMVELLLSSYRRHTAEFWTDMRSLAEITDQDRLIRMGDVISSDDQNSFIRTREVISADHLYIQLTTTVTDVDPYDLKNSCELTKNLRAIHFSHAACDNISFCSKERGSVLEYWFETWRGYCIPKTESQSSYDNSGISNQIIVIP